MLFYLPETRGVPLEEIGSIFGDSDKVVVYSQDIHVDRNTHQLVMESHDLENADLVRQVTELHKHEITESEYKA